MYCYSAKNLIFPYLSVYKRSESEGWSQIGEWREDLDYTISEGKLNFAPESKKGAIELALTNDYIVLLQRDTEVEENISNKDMRGRNMASLPRSLFVYDYDLNLRKIVICLSRCFVFVVMWRQIPFMRCRLILSLN